jgi:signal peptidase II
VAALVLTADAVSKAIVVDRLAGRSPVRLVDGVLDLELTRNAGAAFSLRVGSTVIFTAVAIAVVVIILRTARGLRSLGWAVSLGLLLGGALGNLGDRIFRAPGPFRGEVIDWIHLTHWPIFNLADAAITIGAVLAVALTAFGRTLDAEPDGPRAADPDDLESRRY